MNASLEPIIFTFYRSGFELGVSFCLPFPSFSVILKDALERLFSSRFSYVRFYRSPV